MGDIRPTLNNWLTRSAERLQDLGDEESLRMAGQLRDLVTYIEGCDANDNVLVPIEVQWSDGASEPPSTAQVIFMDYVRVNPDAQASALLTQLVHAMEAHP
jgi:hypothetical protein